MKKKAGTEKENREFDRFRELAKKLVNVPKKDIREAESRAAKPDKQT